MINKERKYHTKKVERCENKFEKSEHKCGDKETTAVSEAKIEPRAPSVYKCLLCDKTFDRAQQLGGHISKSHPGTSKKYGEKIARRNERQGVRDLLHASKDVAKSIDPDLDPMKNRNKVNKVR